MSAYDIFLTFDRIGDVENVEKSADDKFTVTFADLAAPLTNANANAHDKPTEQPAKRPKIDINEPTIHETSDLNNHCWMHILERLPVRDLYEVAHTCKRFHAIATRVFHARFKDRQFEQNDLVCGEHPSASLSLYVHAIRTFKPKDVQIPRSRNNSDIVVRTMIEHCADLEQLDTYYYSLGTETIAALWPILPRLKKLKMYAKQMPPASDDILWHTEQLNIWYEPDSPPIPIKMPKLTALTFDSIEGRNDPFIFGLLANHPQIEALSFISVNMSIHELWSLPEYVQNIKSLSLNNCNIDGTRNVGDQSVGGFKRLKECFINDNNFNVVQPLLDGSPIQRFSVKNVAGTRLIDGICRLTTITHLYLGFDVQTSSNHNIFISHGQWVQLAEALNQLQSLRTMHMDITLRSVKCILEQSVKLNKLAILYPNGYEQLEIITAECDAISALIAARPELSVKVCSMFAIDVSPVDAFNFPRML